MAKKYYWLKLQKDFFKRHDIRIVEGMPNGKDYVLFYMKLLVESISHEGELRFSETIPYNEDMLSTITNTNIDVVRSAVKIFCELELMDVMEDGTVYMKEVQTMIGEETDWAEKKRIYREKKTLSGQKGTLSDKSKSLELEKELDSNIRIEPEKSVSVVETVKPLSKMKDDLAQYWQESITSIQPDSTWSNHGKERQQINILAGKTRNLFASTSVFTNENELVVAILEQFVEMREYGKDKRINGCPVLPSKLSQFWAEITTALAENHRAVEIDADFKF